MARSRMIHPPFFTNGAIYRAEVDSGLPLRVAFSGLWCHADREGRFAWDADRLALGILPFDKLDFGAVLDALAAAQFIVRYEVDGRVYGHIPSFLQHQRPHPREAPSKAPAPPRLALGKPRSGRGNAKSAGVGISSLRYIKPSESCPSLKDEMTHPFEDAWAAYPKRPNNSRAKALRAWEAQVAKGADPAAILAGTLAYAAYVKREGVEGKFVKLASTFFGPDKHWETDYQTPPSEPIAVYTENGDMSPAFARAMGIIR